MLAVMDVGGWQNIIELSSGKELNLPLEDYKIPRELARDNPYPGDMDDESLDWVRDCAQRVVDAYSPDLMLMCYAQPLFIELYAPEDKDSARKRQQRIIQQVDEFAKKNGYKKIIVMTGAYDTLLGEITQPSIKGFLEQGAWGNQIAGISATAPEDYDVLKEDKRIKLAISKKEITDRYPDLDPRFKSKLPETIVMAQDGYIFRGQDNHKRKVHFADIGPQYIPVMSEIGMPAHLCDIKQTVTNALDSGEKVLLCVVEGYRHSDFPKGFEKCDNTEGWYSYRGLDFYMALFTGKPFYKNEFPPVFARMRSMEEKRKYPLSGFFTEPVTDAVGNLDGYKTAAVASRSMIIHMAMNADITLECYTREHSKMGNLVAFKPKKIG